MINFNTIKIDAEQQLVIDDYRNRWQNIACLTERIDREKARLAIKAAYEFIDLAEPNILFFSSPYEALDYIYNEVNNSWGKLVNTSLSNPVAGKLTGQLLSNIKKQITEEIANRLQGDLDGGLADNIASETAIKIEGNRLFSIIWANAGELARISSQNTDANDMSKFIFNLFFEAGFVFNNYISFPIWQAQRYITSFFSDNSQNKSNINQMFSGVFTSKFKNKNKSGYQLPIVEVSSNVANVIIPSVMADYGYYIDYFYEVLNCDRDEIKWNIFYDLITNCGWIFPYEKTVIVCQRTTSIDFDINNDLS